MRLSKNERDTIISVIGKYDKNADIFLFGSRIDDNKKGGDIDLLVDSNILGFDEKLKILIELKSKIGDQKIDLLFKKTTSKNFLAIIEDEKIQIN